MGSGRLSREVRERATEFGIRPELRFNDLRGTKVTEMVWSGISVPDLAIRIGWRIETAAKMLGVYAALNPGRTMVVALPAPAKREDATSEGTHVLDGHPITLGVPARTFGNSAADKSSYWARSVRPRSSGHR